MAILHRSTVGRPDTNRCSLENRQKGQSRYPPRQARYDVFRGLAYTLVETRLAAAIEAWKDI